MAIIELTIIVLIIIVLALLFGVKSPLPLPITIILISLLVLIVIILYIFHERKKGTSLNPNDTKELLLSQVKFYDFIFKAITIFLALSALLIYKDRQDMRDKFESDYKRMELYFSQKTDSIITDAEGKIAHSVKTANEAISSLKFAVRDAETSKNKVLIASQNVEIDYNKISDMRKDVASWIYTQKKSENKNFFGIELKYCPLDSSNFKRDDKWFNNIGIECCYQGLFEKAESMFVKSLEIYPKNKQAIANMGYLYFTKFTQEGYAQSLEYMKKYIEFYPDEYYGYVNLAQCLMMLGDKTQEAYNNLEHALFLGYDDYAFIEANFCLKDSNFRKLFPRDLR